MLRIYYKIFKVASFWGSFCRMLCFFLTFEGEFFLGITWKMGILLMGGLDATPSLPVRL